MKLYNIYAASALQGLLAAGHKMSDAVREAHEVAKSMLDSEPPEYKEDDMYGPGTYLSIDWYPLTSAIDNFRSDLNNYGSQVCGSLQYIGSSVAVPRVPVDLSDISRSLLEIAEALTTETPLGVQKSITDILQENADRGA